MLQSNFTKSQIITESVKKIEQSARPCHIVFDSTGLKVYGEGEWKVRKHGWSKRRTWRKLHIGMDPDSKEIIVSELTSNGSGSGDSEIGKKLMDRLPRSIKKVLGDGAYDDISFRRSAKNNGADVIVPPPRNAALHDSDDPAVIERNDAIKQIIGLGDDEDARALWKILTGYHERSLGETTMYRIKQLTGSSLQSRTKEAQSTEAYVKCLIINKMTMMGMPKSSWI